MNNLALKLFNIAKPVSYEEAFKQSNIPYGVYAEPLLKGRHIDSFDPEDEYYRPGSDVPKGNGCGLVCPTCIRNGRDIKESMVCHVISNTPDEWGRYAAYFRHISKPDPSFPCYFKEKKTVYRKPLEDRDHRGESNVHRLCREFFIWRGELNSSSVKGFIREAAYPNSAYRHDGLLIDTSSGDRLYLEVEVSHATERDKGLFLQKFEYPTMALNVMYRDTSGFKELSRKLYHWDALTNMKNRRSAGASWAQIEDAAHNVEEYFFNPKSPKVAFFNPLHRGK